MNPPTKVLVVDDEPHVLAFVAKLVRVTLGNPTVLQAADAATAISLFEGERPALVLLDVNLIGTSGLTLLRQMRALDPAAVVVMLTSVATRKTVEDALSAGASGYILKDEDYERMGQALREVAQTTLPAVAENPYSGAVPPARATSTNTSH